MYLIVETANKTPLAFDEMPHACFVCKEKRKIELATWEIEQRTGLSCSFRKLPRRKAERLWYLLDEKKQYLGLADLDGVRIAFLGEWPAWIYAGQLCNRVHDSQICTPVQEPSIIPRLVELWNPKRLFQKLRRGKAPVKNALPVLRP